MRSLDDLLATSVWARELAPDQLQRARSAILVRDLQPGGYACHKGNQASAWVGVIDGLVKLVSVSGSGKSVTFAAVPAGSWFGEGSVLKREVRKYDGTSRQRVCQALQVLEDAGLIEVDYRMITVLDIDGLRDFGS